MNRQQRRLIEKNAMKEQDISRANAKKLVYLSGLRDKENAPDIPDGTAVKIDAARILSVHGKKNPKYLEFIKENRGKLFHVSRDDPKATNTIVVLEEDPTEIKWLFHVSDLIVVKEESNV